MKILNKINILLIGLLTAGTAALAAGPKVPRRDEKPKMPIEKPDMELIKKEILDPKGKYYYPRLMEKFQRNDTVMTHQEFRHLYLGALYQEDFDPYRQNDLDDKVKELYYKNDHTRAELDTIIAYAERSLEDDPFDLEQMNYLIYALNKRKKTHKAKIQQYKLNHLAAAILSTGTGADPDNAWIVIDQKHEYFIVNSHGGIIENVEYQQPYYEFARLMKNDAKSKDKKPEGYYFNLKYLLDEYYRKYPEQLNN